MAESDVPVFETNPFAPPHPFAAVAWLGMSPEQILAGLKDGSIAPPPGAPPDWMPPGLSLTPGTSPILQYASSDTSTQHAAAANGTDTVDSTGGTLIDRARVRGWFHALDATLTDSAFDAIWKRSGDSDSARAESLTGYLARTLLGTPASNTDGAIQAQASISGQVSAALTTFTADASHHAHIVDLAGMDGAELARRAQTDIGYRYALTQFDTMAITGNRSLFAATNADGHLDRFDPDTGENQLSDNWLADRGKFLAWKMAGDAGGKLAVDGDQSWTFIDRAKMGADGLPLTLYLTGSAQDAKPNQVVFGAESAEFLKGGAGTDRIYGGGGDDTLRGAAGADYLEGGRGDDLAMGGAGSDELAGNQGNDELDGGRGADLLNGGSGDDILTGGRGDDLLAGGDGADTYVIDAGDGADTITDSDGQGTIALDDESLTGAVKGQSGMWTSEDGRLDYTADGDINGESTLTIRAYEAGTRHDGSPDNVIQIHNWRNGDLGIALGAGDPQTPIVDGANSDTQDSGAGVQVIADNIPIDSIPTPGLASDTGSPAADAPTEIGAGVSNGAESSADSGAAAFTGQAPATDAPQLDPASDAQATAINDAITQLLAAPNNDVTALSPSQLQHAVAAFSGVLAPPDVSFASSGDHVANAVSIADVSGALADDTGGHDASGETAAGMGPLAPDWHHIEGITVPIRGSTRSVGLGTRISQP